MNHEQIKFKLLGNRAADEKRRYLAANCFELFVAFLAIFSAVGFFLSPDSLDNSAAGQLTHPFDYIWNTLYLAGAVLIVRGLLKIDIRVESVGLCLFTAAVVINAIALLVIAGTAVLPSILIFTAFAGACLARLVVLGEGIELDILEALKRRHK